ncbi:MAG: alanine dehydrogenase [Planctomycetes bacterium]|jgi:alanine dehydrogenase|nr:alanine dehydrogenase [Planctomycetota bacterium]
MIVGVPKEIKKDEYRVGLLPVGAQLLTQDGHTVLIEKDAGLASGFDDQQYALVGAEIVATAEDIYSRADLIVKVKEPQPSEIARLRAGQVMFCYFHFASSHELTAACLNAGITAVAYETLMDPQGRLPLLTPMSEIAGRMSIQEGAKCLERPMGGRGVVLGGVPGVVPANVLVLGGGVVGTNAARMAAGLAACVTITDINLNRLRYLDEVMPANVHTIFSDPHTIENCAIRADLIIGSVLIPGGRAPVLIPRPLLQKMKPGSVIVDVAIDQGGCTEMSRPTTHSDPTYVVDGVVYYCVANIPGAVCRTSTPALCNATLPYVRELAGLGMAGFQALDTGHAAAIDMADHRLLNRAVAAAFPDLAGT